MTLSQATANYALQGSSTERIVINATNMASYVILGQLFHGLHPISYMSFKVLFLNGTRAKRCIQD